MFALAIFLGIYSYIIFILGLFSLLYTPLILLVTLIFVVSLAYYFKKELATYYLLIRKRDLGIDRFSKTILFLIIAQGLINIIGVLGPELGFDALWYHLTLPKIFLSEHKVFHIPGGLLYYSDMPKLGEMFFAGALAFGNETTAKLIHFSFGILTLFAIFNVSREVFNIRFALLASLIFYSNLVAGWQSTTAYIDLFRTFFEVMALWGFLNWFEKKDRKWLIESSIMLGLAISTKLLAVYSLLIFLPLIIYAYRFKKYDIRKTIADILVFLFVSVSVALPWFVFSYLNTANPIYPVFSQYYPSSLSLSLLNPINIAGDLFNLFFKSNDPISPVYIVLLPLLPLFFKRFSKEMRIISLYCPLALVSWYLIPRTGGGRFILPYLPAFSILAVYLMIQKKALQKTLIVIVIFISITSIGYRFIANSKFIPVILGKETKQEFLTKNLNFSYGDFYDTDNYFKKNIKGSDRVLLFGFHNLYYIDFPFIDSSYVRKGDLFNYIATQNADLPNRFRYWNLIYENKKTNVKLYSLGGETWYY